MAQAKSISTKRKGKQYPISKSELAAAERRTKQWLNSLEAAVSFETLDLPTASDKRSQEKIAYAIAEKLGLKKEYAYIQENNHAAAELSKSKYAKLLKRSMKKEA